jgi:hypothetical protein
MISRNLGVLHIPNNNQRYKEQFFENTINQLFMKYLVVVLIE